MIASIRDKLMTPEEVADHLRITRHTVYGWLRRGKLTGQRVGRGWRVSEAELLKFLEQGQPWRG